ncbi:cupin [Streptomyces roseifaciens]
MTLLTTWPDSGPRTLLLRTGETARIAAALAPAGVRFERWPVRGGVPAGASAEAVLAAYAPEVDRLTAEEGFAAVDVAALHPDGSPGWPAKAAAAREKFLAEHTHDEDDEIRFFVAGSGAFYLHVDGLVHAVCCERGDLLGVPRGTRHWFDMGTVPSFTAIRFFQVPDGWAASFTGSDIASRFPAFDELRSGRAA